MEEMNLVKEDSVSKEIENRKKKIIHFFKEKTSWIIYGILTVILAVSVYIRTLPMRINPATGKPGLWDITTNNWTLGPDLDPFLFLRWTKDIVEHGKLFILDTMRSVPLAHICSGATCDPVNTANEMQLLSYIISYFYKFLSLFNKSITVEYASVLYPVVLAVLTGIAFFLFARKLFYKEGKKVSNIIALIATAFFVLVPSLLPRTIAGIPGKESTSFLFIFLSYYFFLEAITSDKLKRGLIFGALAGMATGILSLIQGVGDVVFLGIGLFVFVEFILGKINKEKFYIYSIWIAGFIALMTPFSVRYSIVDLIESASTAICFLIFFILLLNFLIMDKKIFKLDEKIKKMKLPSPVIFAVGGVLLLAVVSSIFFGISFVPGMVQKVISNTIQPITLGRFGITVAENKPSYFISDWTDNFGPTVFNIPLYFWLFFAGSVFLFYYGIKKFEKREKQILISSYILFLVCLIFSKYSTASVLNGDSNLSLTVYFGGTVIFLISLAYIYFKRNKSGSLAGLKELNSADLFYIIILTIMIIAARGSIRLIMFLGAVSPAVIAFLIVKLSQKYLSEKEDFKKMIAGIIVFLVILASIITIWNYYQSDKSTGENYIPGIYQWQWQKAMEWVRDNTPTTAVFAHWWDYGYWVQTIGERATILDGGNAIGYWNYFMGRNVLTGTNEKDALDFLYAHNATNLLIDSTDIGKYGAFSSIGSDENYDRYSWIPTIFLDDQQTKETSNETDYVYQVGTVLDQDLIVQNNGQQVLLPAEKAVVAVIMVSVDNSGNMLQPRIFFMYNNQQYVMPLRYIYSDGKLYDFNSGFDAGIYIFPRIDTSSDGKMSAVKNGAAFYLSERTINSELVKLYLFGENSNYFKLVHTEDSIFVDSLNTQGASLGNFVYYQGLQGPIKIWQISYPANQKLNETYLNTDYPAELETVKPGVYS